MKKAFLLIMVLLTISLLFTFGCSKKSSTSSNDDNNNESLDPTTYGYYMAIFKNYSKTNDYYVYIYKEEGQEINSVTLKINDNPYEVVFEPFYGGWLITEPVALSEGEEYSFYIAINENYYVKNFDLTIPYTINANWPETIDLEQTTHFEWTIEKNPDYQDFYGDAYNYQTDESVENYKILSTSARSFDMPANWLPKDYNEYTFTISNMNYYRDSDKFLAACMEYAEMDYGYKKNQTKSLKDKIQYIKKLILNIK